MVTGKYALCTPLMLLIRTGICSVGMVSHDVQLEWCPDLSLNTDSIKRELFDWNDVRIKSVYG